MSTFCFQKFVDNAQQCFEGEGEGDGIESRLPFKMFSTLPIMQLKVSISRNNYQAFIQIIFS